MTRHLLLVLALTACNTESAIDDFVDYPSQMECQSRCKADGWVCNERNECVAPCKTGADCSSGCCLTMANSGSHCAANYEELCN